MHAQAAMQNCSVSKCVLQAHNESFVADYTGKAPPECIHLYYADYVCLSVGMRQIPRNKIAGMKIDLKLHPINITAG